MKMNKTIVNSALAAGLLAFAPIQTQAGLVIDNSVVSPFKVRIVGTYVNTKNQVAKVAISNKDILNDQGAPKGSQLARWEGDIVVINDKTIWETGVATIILDNWTSNQIDGKDGSLKYAENGLMDVIYDGTEFSFDVTGVYTYHYNQSALNKNGNYSVAEKFNSSSLTGSGYDKSLDYDLPASGSVSGSGSGELVD